MNYIRHLNHILECFSRDKRIIPRHISMYMALFFLWNKFKFPDTIHIVRHELMPLSKIGSLKYYHLTLNELDEWTYIRYQPSKSVYRASSVKMLTCFNSETCIETSSESSTATASGSSDATTSNTDNETGSTTTGEAINTNINQTISKTKETIENKSEHTGDAHSKTFPAEDSDQTNDKTDKPEPFQKPTQQELKNYFQSKETPPEEAERFFNHFESNGWKVGGKSPMKDWKAAARNWILNINRYQRSKAKSTENPLSTGNDKDYGEPL